MRVLIIGFGSIGKRHAANARALGHDVFVTDRDPNKLVQAEAIGYLAALPADGWIDAAVIASPASEHGFNLRQVYRQWPGVPVLVEKPLGLSAYDFDGIPSDVTARTFVACNWRLHPLVQGLKARAVADGLVLSQSKAAFWCQCDMAAWPGRYYADALLEIGSHELDLALALCWPARLTSVYHKLATWELELDHEGGTKSTVTINGAGSAPSRGACLLSSDVLIGYEVDYDDPAEPLRVASSYVEEMRVFLSLETPRNDLGLATFADGMAVLRICDDARAMVAAANVTATIR